MQYITLQNAMTLLGILYSISSLLAATLPNGKYKEWFSKVSLDLRSVEKQVDNKGEKE